MEPPENLRPIPALADKGIPRDRPIDEAATEMAKKRMLPRPPAKRLSYEEMQEYFKLLTPEMWQHVTIYIYRNHPRIIRKLKNPDAPNYIDSFGQPFDMDYMIEHHGGGKYHLIVVDDDLKNNNKMFECDFEVNPSEHPPKLNYEELDINHKGNMAYVALLQHKGILDSKGLPMAAAQPAVSSEMLKETFEFVSKMNAEQQQMLKERLAGSDQQSLSKSIGELLLEKMKQDDPNKQQSAFLTLIKEVIASKPDNGSQMKEFLQIIREVVATNRGSDANQPSWKDVLAMVNESHKTYLTMFQSMMEAKKEPPPNPQIETLEQVLNVAERINGIRGGGSSRHWSEIGLDYVKELAPPILNFMSLRMNGRPMPAVANAAGAASFDPYANPQAMRDLARTINQQTPANPPTQTPMTPANELQALVQNYGGLVVQHLNMGTTGYAFGDLITGLLGTGTHAQICAQGEPALVQALLSTPETSIFGEARLKKFVHEFVNFQEFLDQEEREDDSEDAGMMDDARPAAGGMR